jgi:hypothetical protein
VPFVFGASTSTASRPAFVTIMIRPSVGRDGRIQITDLPDSETGILPVGLTCRTRG